MLNIETGRNDVWSKITPKQLDALIQVTGFADPTEGFDLCALALHASECYAMQDWRVVDALGNTIIEYLAD
jgi:hypothetical protein